MLTAEQLAERRTGIGSSDIAAIVEQDPHRAAIDVYLDKLGLAEHDESVEQWCGDRLEQAVADMYAERMGAVLLRGSTYRHIDHPWALCTPDRLVDSQDEMRTADRIVEIKNVGGHQAHRWGEGPRAVPIEKYLQVQWQAEVLDVDVIDLAALIGGTDFRVYRIGRDRELGAELLEIGRAFWEGHVLARVPPPMSGEAAKRLAALRYPKSDGRLLPASAEALALRDKLLRVGRAEKRIADLRARYEAAAREMIGAADGITGCFTWKTDRAGRVNWKDVAEAVGATAEQIAAHTGEPARRFLAKEPREKKGRGRRA